MKQIKVLSIPIYEKNISSKIDEMINEIFHGIRQNKCISFTGAHGLVIAQKNKYFFKILNEFDSNLPDGMPGVIIGRLKGAKEINRCYGPDFFKEMMIATAKKEINHFFCGGKEGVANELKEAVGNKFKNFNIVGTFTPPFREMTIKEIQQLADRINKTNAHIVWIGLSTPKQEILAYKLSKYTNVNYICTIGAAFDFHTGKVKQAPKWVQRLAMEWFFRLLMEPKRLWKRYLEIVPLFIFYNFIEVMTGKFISYKNQEK